jgi:hypothetical protein
MEYIDYEIVSIEEIEVECEFNYSDYDILDESIEELEINLALAEFFESLD